MSIFQESEPLSLTSPDDTRLHAMADWLRTDLGKTVQCIRPASSDASFRRYFRVWCEPGTYIAMDAPPPLEDIRPFVRIAELIRGTGVRPPRIHAKDETRGFLLLDDFGSDNYLDRLDEGSADTLYGDAMNSLIDLQAGVDTADCALPDYTEALLRNEMDLFRDWFLDRLLALPNDPKRDACLEHSWQLLVESALEQPKVCVHRDYHSRNLMVIPDGNPGILDFQDAVLGPITYDLVSLLRDCYISWPQAKVHAWMAGYHQRLHERGLTDSSLETFTRWFDLMGIQRHLKAVGIFARLKLRDGKSGYLKDIPRTLGYILAIAERYPELSAFLQLLQEQVADRTGPALSAAA